MTVLVNDLIAEGRVFEGATGEAPRGRKPKFLYLDSRRRCVVAIDLRPTRSFLMVTDIVGEPLVGMTSFPTERDPERLVVELAEPDPGHARAPPGARPLRRRGRGGAGMVDRTGTRVLFAPRLGWHDVAFQEPLRGTDRPAGGDRERRQGVRPGAALGRARRDGGAIGLRLPERVRRARRRRRHERPAAARAGTTRAASSATSRWRSKDRAAPAAPQGCWEAHVSNLATVSRYLGRELDSGKPIPSEVAALTVEDVISRSRQGDAAGRGGAAGHREVPRQRASPPW